MLSFAIFALIILLSINMCIGLSAFIRDVFEYKKPIEKYHLKTATEVYEEMKKKAEQLEKEKKEGEKNDSIFN